MDRSEYVVSPVKFQQMMPKLIPEVDQVYPTYDSDTSLLTPDAKVAGNKVHQVDSASSGGANSSDLSLKEGSESSSLSLSDSDSESSNSTNAYNSLSMNTDKKGMFFQTEEKKKATYEELLKKVAVYEDEIKVSNLRWQKSEEEVFWLKTELRKGAETLQSRLEYAYGEIDDKEADLKTEKRRVLELETKLAEDSWLAQNQIKLAREEIEALKAELSFERKQVTALEESNSSYRTLHVSSEHKLTQCEAEKMKMKTSYDAQEIQFRGEISRLKVDLNCRAVQVEGLIKSYDTVKAERDESNAKVDRMRDEIHNQEIQKKDMEENLGKLNLKNGEMVEELRLRAVELEKEVDRQTGEILAMAEEKREAIRQLCFSLEHYRSDYRELREAVVGQKRVRVVA